MVFYCEQAAGFCNGIGYQDDSYFNALVRMFDQALKVVNTMPVGARDALMVRLNRVRIISHNFGYGVGDDLDSILASYSKRRA
jgi:hypothetical protein